MSQRDEDTTGSPTARVDSYSEEQIRRRGPLVHFLSHGTFYSALTAAGAGVVGFDGLALNRWLPDPVRESGGYVLYLRDRDDGRFWSATLQPGIVAPDHYDVRFQPGLARFERVQAGIRSVLEVFLAAKHSAELRLLTVRNEDDRARRLDVTSFVEIVLNDPEADHAHPAFSKLFVQTRFDGATNAVHAWRRQRSPDERPAHLVHCAFGGGTHGGFETSRPHFLGRARSARNPVGMRSGIALEGIAGSVLDPAAVLRRTIDLAPGDESHILFVLGAGREAAEMDAMVGNLGRAEGGLQALREADASRVRHSRSDPTMDAVRRRIYSALGAEAAKSAPADQDTRVRSNGSAQSTKPILYQSAYGPAKADIGSASGVDVEPLLFENGYGGFSADGREYVIRVHPDGDGGMHLPPQPWTNVIANDQLGFIVSETGAGCTWSRNSRENRLTPWYNDFVSDPHGEALYVRDERARTFWSATPGPAPAPAAYEVRHGLGYTTFRLVYDGLEHETTHFVAADDPLKLTRLRLRNISDQPRSISLFWYVDLVLGSRPDVTRPHLQVKWDDTAQAILARNPESGEYRGQLIFAAARGGGAVFATTDRQAFLSRFGDLDQPGALTHATALNAAPATAGSCAALQLCMTIPAHGEAVAAFLLGDGGSTHGVQNLLDRYGRDEAWEVALEATRRTWNALTGKLQVRTPAPEIDLMVNSWLPYQNLSCRMRGRSAFYQSGGAFGFRDQLQDAAGLLYLDPAITRRQILLHAANQFVEGDVMHWWHPPTGKGIRTRFSDDLLWLPFVTVQYVGATGDRSILRERVPYLTARRLEPGEDEVFLQPEDSEEEGDLFEHCCRAIDRSLAVGAHRLPLMGTGDWNDGMNRVGREGRGESVWLGFFLYYILDRFIPICSFRGELERSDRYDAHRNLLREALNDAGWDGAWYRRAYYDNGDPLGSRDSDECRIDALAQAWAVISGVAPEERARQALDAMEQFLVDEKAGIIRLLAPAFDRTKNDPGYIKGYVPGVRENGGQYTHGVLWSIRALAEAGRGSRATTLLRMLSPVHHARTREAADRYRVEPYVIAADVYGEPPHVGRGGWTWYTGSAAWMYRVAVESVLGFRLEGGTTIVLDPSVDPAWDTFSITYQLPDHPTRYEIEVRNPNGRTRGVGSVLVDDAPLGVLRRVARIPIDRDGRTHRVIATM